jgi:hypothetical protein
MEHAKINGVLFKLFCKFEIFEYKWKHRVFRTTSQPTRLIESGLVGMAARRRWAGPFDGGQNKKVIERERKRWAKPIG